MIFLRTMSVSVIITSFEQGADAAMTISPLPSRLIPVASAALLAACGGPDSPVVSASASAVSSCSFEDVNTGPLPAGCVKISGQHLGRAASHTFGGAEITLDDWTEKEPGQYIGFDYSLERGDAYISVKSGRDVHAESGLDGSWRNPNGDGRHAKAISNIVFCDCGSADAEAPASGAEEAQCWHEGRTNNGHGNNADGVDSSNPGQSKDGEDQSCTDGGECYDDELRNGATSEGYWGPCEPAAPAPGEDDGSDPEEASGPSDGPADLDACPFADAAMCAPQSGTACGDDGASSDCMGEMEAYCGQHPDEVACQVAECGSGAHSLSECHDAVRAFCAENPGAPGC